jgi:hypothetical protein
MRLRLIRVSSTVTIVVAFAAFVVGARIGLFGGDLWGLARPFRDPAVARQQFQSLLAACSRQTTHADVMQMLRTRNELGYGDHPKGTRINLLPRMPPTESWDWFAQIMYGTDGRIFYIRSGYATSQAGAIPGIPQERCFLPPGECSSALDAFMSRSRN